MLNVGEKVFVLMPTCNAKMFVQWSGEYPVTRCLDNDRYEIQLERRKAIFHINSIKRFIEREQRVGEFLSPRQMS